jgi:hypothetical protein
MLSNMTQKMIGFGLAGMVWLGGYSGCDTGGYILDTVGYGTGYITDTFWGGGGGYYEEVYYEDVYYEDIYYEDVYYDPYYY